MTAKSNTDTTDVTTTYPSLAAALAAFQSALPNVAKNAAGQVRGNPNYKYADLADLTRAVLPELGKYGLSFSAKPTLNAAGRFVLAYVLRHDSGQSDEGEYPLPEDVSPQDMGSAQTYARRYILQGMSGVAPDGQDDDGAAATRAYSHRSTARASQPAAREQRTDPAEGPPAEPPAVSARKRLAGVIAENNWDRDVVAARFQAQFDQAIGEATDAHRINAFTKNLYAVSDIELRAPVAANGAAQ